MSAAVQMPTRRNMTDSEWQARCDLAALYRVDGVAEAIELANATNFGLGSNAWTNDADERDRCIRELLAGQVFINTYGAAGGVELPFGGWKKSGYGREKGFEGMLGYTQTKTIAVGL